LYAYFALLCAIAIFSFVTHAGAATVYINPNAASINQNATFTVSVRTDTQGASINVAEATLIFPTDKLAVVKATPGSTFSIQSPGSPGISTGKVFFSAGIPTPGYNGASGILGSVTFKAVESGQANLSLEAVKVLLNDGNASEAAVSKTGSVITIKEVAGAPITEPSPVEESVPVAPEVLTPAPSITVVPQAQDSDIVATITISVKSLIRIIYVLAILLLIFMIATFYLIAINTKLRRRLTEDKPIIVPKRTRGTRIE